MKTLNLTTSYTVLTCCLEGCGITFAVPDHWYEMRRSDHTSWSCPNGHRQHFNGESEAERLRREAVAKQARIDQLKADADYQRAQRAAVERRLQATRGVVTRIKRRVGNGVCPCCNRTFRQLAAHMETKHPSYRADTAEA